MALRLDARWTLALPATLALTILSFRLVRAAGVPVAFGAAYALWTSVAVAALVWACQRRGPGLRCLGLRGTSPRWIAWALAGWFVAGQLWVPLEWGFASFGVPMLWPERAAAVVGARGAGELALLVAVAGLVIPFNEEVLYRGYLTRLLVERVKGRALAVIVSCVVFGATHLFLGPGLAVYATLWSLVPAWLLLKSGSVWPGVVVHAANNLFAYLVVPHFVG